MSRIVVTSVVRRAGLTEPSGYLRVVDLDRRRILATAPVPESLHRAGDPNPRGGRRGAKGVGVVGDRLVIANVERLFVLDPGWRLTQELTHPWAGGVHDVLCERDGVWVACTDADLLAKIAWNGEVVDTWSWRSDEQLRHALDVGPLRPFDGALDYRDPRVAHAGLHNVAHLNGISRGEQGLLVSLGRILPRRRVRLQRAKAVAASAFNRVGVGPIALATVLRRRQRRIDAQRDWDVERLRRCSSALVLLRGADGDRRSEVLLRTETMEGVPNHNVLEVGSALLYNDSNAGELVARDRASGAERRVRIPGSPSFPRGLAGLHDGLFLVGSQRPAAVHAIDLDGSRVVWSLDLAGMAEESVYGLAVLPERFDDPPERIFNTKAAAR